MSENRNLLDQLKTAPGLEVLNQLGALERLQDLAGESALAPWWDLLPAQLVRILVDRRHGDLDRWQQALAALPDRVPDRVVLDTDTVGCYRDRPLSPDELRLLAGALRQLKPWRKGPFRLFDITIDTEWRSDWKWSRLAHHITPLSGRTVLDVGCGSGYHCWRMRGAGARLVIGIDPTLLFWMQFEAVRKYVGPAPVYFLPLAVEQLPADLAAFDTVFSMGILYHRKSPLAHLQELYGALRPGGELVLETLVIDGDEKALLVPEGRYARMRNVWSIPSGRLLEKWLQQAGFDNIRLVDVTVTTVQEQRSTEWMSFQSLADFLDPVNHRLTIEGYPAPQRAILIATRPD